MRGSPTSRGLAIAMIAAFGFGTSGALIKPMFEVGWDPAAAVAVRAVIGALVIMPFAVLALRGAWSAVWRGRWRILLMALVGVAATQLVYFAALERIPVGTAVLIEYTAPLLLVALAWVRTSRMPQIVVIVGSVLAMLGLLLVISPGGVGATGLDGLGVGFAALSAMGCAVYYVVAARPSDGLPAVALAAFGLLIGGVLLAIIGLAGLVPFNAPLVDVPVPVLGTPGPWWVPLVIVGVVGTGIAYAAGIAAGEMLGSRLASFAGLLEVVAAALYAWLLLGETLTAQQLVGGALILAGIAFVRSETSVPANGLGDVVPPGTLRTTPVTVSPPTETVTVRP